jgi:hypothetical protein
MMQFFDSHSLTETETGSSSVSAGIRAVMIETKPTRPEASEPVGCFNPTRPCSTQFSRIGSLACD